MKVLLRSVFHASQSDDVDFSFSNFMALSESGLGFDVVEDNDIWEFIKGFSRTHNHSPDVRTIRTHFSTLKKNDILDRVEILSSLKPLYRGDFLKYLEERAEDRRSRLAMELLREANNIIQTGVEIKDGKEKKILRGPIDAIRYFIDKSHDIVTPTGSSRLSGEVTTDGEDFRLEYERIESDPLAGMGQNTGIEQMDQALRGAKKYELWTHAAFTGHLKSTFALNWIYNQSVYMGHSSCYFSLEMPYNQVRRLLYCMHSTHGKFKEERIRLGIQKSPGPSIGISYDKLKYGELSPPEREFMLGCVVPDFNSGRYGKINIEIADPDKSDTTVLDIKSKAELTYVKEPFNLMVVDHALLVSPRKWVPSTTDRLNEVIRDSKRMAMNFNRGAGMAVVILFQINREGFNQAEKLIEKSNGAYNMGPYSLTSLSYANEAERSSDIVTASWLDKNLSSQNRALFQCMKSRDQAAFQNFFAKVDWNSKRMLTSHEVPMVTTPVERNSRGKKPSGKTTVDEFMETLR